MKPLHEHNQKTYKNICRMYNEGIQRIAVVQPTGSGKSLLMGKLIEDNPDSKFFVLSTSHKINDQFKEKLDEEMLKRLECNIYCNMPNMKKEDMEVLQPDYILLDEMHRALAREWSKGIKVLLEMYPNAKVLGLSATPIRYLDKRRNVVKELFNDNLACDMNLSQAILDGILPMARYVCGVYSYEKDAESLNKKIERSYNSEDEKKELFKQVKILKENLDKGNGVSDIFRKYIMTGNEKFVVFLKDTKHLRRMRPVIKKWFNDAGFSSVRMYEVHSKNIDKDKEFQAFKNDTEEGIKLCLSVNMVAEGIHGDINGVIMLRETISPNLYFQMIGRAFACDKKIIPLIFDLVANSQFISEMADNFPNELRGEIERRKKECEKEGKEYEVGFDVDEFIVMDQFMDVVSGFKEIEERLEGSWDLYIKALKQYKERVGDCDVPERYVEVVDGTNVKLGQWVGCMRITKKGNGSYLLTIDRINQLDEIGFIWDVLFYDWENGLRHFDKYVREHNGDVLVPGDYIDIDGFHTGNWVSNMRKKLDLLSKYKVNELNKRGFVWDVYKNRFERNIKNIAEYYEKLGKYPSHSSEDIEIRKLWGFIIYEKKKMRNKSIIYPEWKKEILDKYLPNFSCETRSDKSFNEFVYYAKLYKERYGHLNIQCRDIIDGYNVGIKKQTLSRCKSLSEDQKKQLEILGIYLGSKLEKQFNNKMDFAKQAIEDGVIINNQNRKYRGTNLYDWVVGTVKRRYVNKNLSLEEIQIIEKLMGKPLDELYCGRKEPVKVRVIDVIENKEVGIFESKRQVSKMMQEKFGMNANGRIIEIRLNGKITTPYKGRFMFYRVDKNGEVTE